MRDLAGKRALVTGAASGIGRAVTLELARRRVDLFLLDVNDVGLEAAARDARRLGVDVVSRRCDVARSQDLAAAAGEAIERWAGVDVLVNNAGVTYWGMTHFMPAEELEKLLAVNLTGAVRLTRELLPWMLARPRAHVLNMCSVLGLVGLPRVALYCTTKFAMVGFSDSLRSEYGRQGLGVTALCPGLVKTNLFSSARPMRDGEVPRSPPGFLCTSPERVARTAVRAIRRNRRMVLVEPYARALYAAKRWAPGLIDWTLRLGEGKRARRKAQRLAQLSDDPVEALRLCVLPEEQPPRRAAA